MCTVYIPLTSSTTIKQILVLLDNFQHVGPPNTLPTITIHTIAYMSFLLLFLSQKGDFYFLSYLK